MAFSCGSYCPNNIATDCNPFRKCWVLCLFFVRSIHYLNLRMRMRKSGWVIDSKTQCSAECFSRVFNSWWVGFVVISLFVCCFLFLGHVLSDLKLNRVFSHDVTAAILVSQNNKTAAMLVSQTNPPGVELFSYAYVFFCSNKFPQMLATWLKTLYCLNDGLFIFFFKVLWYDFKRYSF